MTEIFRHSDRMTSPVPNISSKTLRQIFHCQGRSNSSLPWICTLTRHMNHPIAAHCGDFLGASHGNIEVWLSGKVLKPPAGLKLSGLIDGCVTGMHKKLCNAIVCVRRVNVCLSLFVCFCVSVCVFSCLSVFFLSIFVFMTCVLRRFFFSLHIFQRLHKEYFLWICSSFMV